MGVRISPYFEVDGALGVLHTGVFATREEVRYATAPVHHADAAVSMLMRKPALPAERIDALCRSYGLPFRNDGAHFAILTGCCELVYVYPGKA